MKKGLIFLLGIISFFGINTVKADEIYLEYDTNINKVKTHIDTIGYDNVNNSINEIINYYNENYANEYPYYYISLWENGLGNFTISLRSFSKLDYSFIKIFYSHSTSIDYRLPMGGDIATIEKVYDISINNFNDIEHYLGTYSNSIIFHMTDSGNYYNPYNYYYSNFDYYYKGELLKDLTNTYISINDTIHIPTFENSTKYNLYSVGSNFIINPYYLYDDDSTLEDNRYTTINLNDYSYIILSLKDYTPRETFNSPGYYKGQLCTTPVYNYGSEEKKDYISGWQAPPCGDYLENYTFFNLIIREEDIKNHAVLYLTGYDSSKPNSVMVDNSTFNITYITSETENNPSVSIEGKYYNTLPYSSLTDTSFLTEKNGIDTTWTCAKYDTDCLMDSSGIDVDNLFSNPLETLKGVWDTITSIFKLITEFILLLPPTMQAFLYLAFGVGIALGIIKIIL